MERLAWLETVLANVDPRVTLSTFIKEGNSKLTLSQDPEIREVSPRILGVLQQRLESQYMRIAEIDPRDLALKRIPSLAKQARDLKSLTGQR